MFRMRMFKRHNTQSEATSVTSKRLNGHALRKIAPSFALVAVLVAIAGTITPSAAALGNNYRLLDGSIGDVDLVCNNWNYASRLDLEMYASTSGVEVRYQLCSSTEYGGWYSGYWSNWAFHNPSGWIRLSPGWNILSLRPTPPGRTKWNVIVQFRRYGGTATPGYWADMVQYEREISYWARVSDHCLTKWY